MSEDRTNAARQSRYQARKRSEFEALKLKVKEYEAQAGIAPIDLSQAKAEERERCAKFCEGGITHQPAGRLLAAGIRMLK